MILSLISVILFIAYALLIGTITIGWWGLKEVKRNDVFPDVKVSVIVAVRNEALNIETLLKSLLAQDYPSHLGEIILVDDHSSDSTVQLAAELIAQKKEQQILKLITLNEKDGSGKKAALHCGIQASEGELIVITDADCTAGKLWISTISSFYAEHRPQMILGPVHMTDKGLLFGKLQSIEFMSLMSSAAGSCQAGIPILANGANMAFTRQAYESCGGFSGNMQFASGDDMFLMMSIKKKFGPKAIRFLRSAKAMVKTPATLEFKAFIRQRQRWVSKSRGYTDPMLIATSMVVFLTNVWLVFTALAGIGIPGCLKLFLICFLLKMLIDLPLMIGYSRFQRSKSLLWLFPVMELLNAVYTLLIGIAGNIGKYEWKGRKVSK